MSLLNPIPRPDNGGVFKKLLMFYLLFLYMSMMGLGACVCHDAHVEVREQLLWVGFLLIPHRCWESELGYPAWESNLVFCKQIELSFTHPQLLCWRWTILVQSLQYNHRYHNLAIVNLRTLLPLEPWTSSLHPSPLSVSIDLSLWACCTSHA